MQNRAQSNRVQILEQLTAKVREGNALLACVAGNGLMARLQDQAEADLIVVSSSGYFRQAGLPSVTGNLPVGDANALVRSVGESEILPRVQQTPVIAGVYLPDPTRDMALFLAELRELGFSGVVNLPSVGRLSGELRLELEQADLGFACEMELMRTARELDLLTIACAYRPEEARAFAEDGADLVVSQIGITGGGDVGGRASPNLDESLEVTQNLLAAAVAARPDVLTLCSGGAISGLQAVSRALRETSAVGFFAGSGVDRLPVESAVKQTIRQLTSLRLDAAEHR